MDSPTLPRTRTRSIVFKLFLVVVLASDYVTFQLIGAQVMEDDLYLSPLIKNGRLEEARRVAQANLKLSHVNTTSKTPIVSYSGFLTVNETFNSNLFFIFFPAMEMTANAPLILQTNEIFGVSILRNAFVETGPLIVDENGILVDNPNTWAKKYNVLYIDAPVGTGFSFTDNPKGEAWTAEDDAEEIMTAITQLFFLFPELANVDLYLTGDNFGGYLTTVLGLRLLDSQNPKISFKGLMLGSPLLNATYQLDITDHLYNLGLIGEEQWIVMGQSQRKLEALVQEKKYDEAADVHFARHVAPSSLFDEYTGFKNYRHALYSEVTELSSRYETFVNTKELHNYLHVGLHKFVGLDMGTIFKSRGSWFRNTPKNLGKLLARGNIRVLVYNSQFDLLYPHLKTYEILKGLEWDGVEEFRRGPRTVWKHPNDKQVTGYVQKGGGLTFVVIRNTGNIPTLERPEAITQLLQSLVADQKL